MERICYQEFDAQDLVTKYPAHLNNRNKGIVFDVSSPLGAIHSGTISFSRWRQMQLPDTVTRDGTRPSFELHEDFFNYDPSPQGRVDWHLNFTNYDLFCAYGGPLFAQDEIQVAEHPALASLRHCLLDAGLKPLTVEHGIPTPVTADEIPDPQNLEIRLWNNMKSSPLRTTCVTGSYNLYKWG